MPVEIKISIQKQGLSLVDTKTGRGIRHYPISTAAKGVGETKGSFCTPRGIHLIRAKIGANSPENTIFVARRATGEIYDAALANAFPTRDFILTRILWLSGCEPGKNRLGEVDTMRRYIYIHGCPAGKITETPSSHGCIRMNNKDIIELFELVPVYTRVEIF